LRRSEKPNCGRDQGGAFSREKGRGVVFGQLEFFEAWGNLSSDEREGERAEEPFPRSSSDELPAGYSLAGRSPAEPASASPARTSVRPTRGWRQASPSFDSRRGLWAQRQKGDISIEVRMGTFLMRFDTGNKMSLTILSYREISIGFFCLVEKL